MESRAERDTRNRGNSRCVSEDSSNIMKTDKCGIHTNFTRERYLQDTTKRIAAIIPPL